MLRPYIFLLILFIFSTSIKAEKIIFTTQGNAQSRFAGYIIAKNLGFYKEVGLDVELDYLFYDKDGIEKLKSGKSQFSTMTLLQGISNRLAGEKIINIMQTSHASSLCMVSRVPFKSKMNFTNKKIAIWKSLDPSTFKLFNLIKNDSNYKIIFYDRGVNLFLSGAVDFIMAKSYDELIQLRQCGFNANSNNTIFFKSRGYNIPEDGIYVTQDYLIANSNTVKKFISASIKGWNWVRANPQKAVEIITQEASKNKVSTNIFVQEQMLNEILRLQQFNPKSPTNYLLQPSEFDATLNLFKKSFHSKRLQFKDFVFTSKYIVK